MTSISSSSVTPLSFAYCRWKVSCSALPPVSSAATVTRLRSRLVSCGRSQTSPNSTSSVKCTSPGAKSPNIFSAPVGSLFSVTSWFSVTSCSFSRVDAVRAAWLGWAVLVSVEGGDGQFEVVPGACDDVQAGVDGAEWDEARAGHRQPVAVVDDEDAVVGRPVGQLPDPVGDDRCHLPGQRPRQPTGLLPAEQVAHRDGQRQHGRQVAGGGVVLQRGGGLLVAAGQPDPHGFLLPCFRALSGGVGARRARGAATAAVAGPGGGAAAGGTAPCGQRGQGRGSGNDGCSPDRPPRAGHHTPAGVRSWPPSTAGVVAAAGRRTVPAKQTAPSAAAVAVTSASGATPVPRPTRGAARPPKANRATPRNEDAVPAMSG